MYCARSPLHLTTTLHHYTSESTLYFTIAIISTIATLNFYSSVGQSGAPGGDGQAEGTQGQSFRLKVLIAGAGAGAEAGAGAGAGAVKPFTFSPGFARFSVKERMIWSLKSSWTCSLH